MATTAHLYDERYIAARQAEAEFGRVAYDAGVNLAAEPETWPAPVRAAWAKFQAAFALVPAHLRECGQDVRGVAS